MNESTMSNGGAAGGGCLAIVAWRPVWQCCVNTTPLRWRGLVWCVVGLDVCCAVIGCINDVLDWTVRTSECLSGCLHRVCSHMSLSIAVRAQRVCFTSSVALQRPANRPSLFINSWLSVKLSWSIAVHRILRLCIVIMVSRSGTQALC